MSSNLDKAIFHQYMDKLPPVKVARSDALSNDEQSSDFDVIIAMSRMLGLMMGLASYHGVLIDLPLPSSIYKIMTEAEVFPNLHFKTSCRTVANALKRLS